MRLKTLDDERNILRSALRARRRQLTAAERIEAATGLARSLEQVPEFLTDPRVAGYWAIDGELPLHSAVASLRSRGQQFHLPCISGSRHLRFAPWRPGIALEPNRYGIPEPAGIDGEWVDAAALDVVLLPMLGFDRQGGRLGYGGGYYDATLAFLRERTEPTRPVLVGIAYAVQQVDWIERAEWDVPLDYIATEVELIDCWQERAQVDAK